jgi:two-component system, cell cycle sensor histidine kinase and response regulator CckA
VPGDRPAWKRDPKAYTPDVLQASQQMVAALLESASQAILSLDHNGKIVLINRRTEELFNYTRAELMGTGIETLLPESKRAIHARHREEYFERPHIRPMGIGMDLVGRKRDGSEFPVEVSLSAMDTDEGIFAIAFVTDISQRKQLEEQLIHAQKMEAVGRLAGGVAHDFNNMLTVIAGYSKMILDELPPDDPLREYAEEIGKAGERAGAITNQLLAFSRRQLIQPRVINVNAVMAQTEKMLRRLLGEDIQLTLDVQEDIANIKADPNQIEQAIVNLAVNSRDAMPNGGQIFLQTAQLDLDEVYVRTHLGVQPGEYVMIAITDTGHGMEAEVRKHIFEPFFTTKERGKGTGLGLATVYGMVKQSGGDIWVYSEPGKGTTFKLYFPVAREKAHESKIEPPPRVEQPSGDTVLVVEDEEPVRDLTVRMLQQLGYSVLAAASGDEAIEISKTFSGTISMLLTDVVLPGMSGPQIAEALLLVRPEMKILYLSGYTENAISHQGLESGADFLPKPFSRETLSRKLAEVIGREK